MATYLFSFIKFELLLAYSLWTTNLLAQSEQELCNCKDIFGKISHHIEQAYAGYPDKINSKTKTEYLALKSNLFKFSEQVKTPLECHQLLLQYLQFYKDPNLFLPFVSSGKLSDRQRLNIAQKEILKQIKLNTYISGLWYSDDKKHKYAIIPYTSMQDAYVMITLNSPDSNWPIGTIKAIFTDVKQQDLKGYVFGKDFSMKYAQGRVENNTLTISDLKVLKEANNQEVPQIEAVNLNAVDDNTLILRIPTFNKPDLLALDSIIKVKESEIKSTKKLIIDLRGNRGGDQFPPMALLQILGRDTLQTPTWAYRVSNIYTEDLAENLKKGKGDKTWYLKFKNANGHFWRENSNSIPIQTTPNAIKDIGIIIDENCANVTEMLIYFSMQSPKVTLFGTATSGSMDYAPSHLFPILCANIPYIQIPIGRNQWVTLPPKNETGLPPDVTILESDNQIQKVIDHLNKLK